MKIKILSLLALFFIIVAVDSVKAYSYPLSLRYHSTKEFPSLRQKLGSTISVAPFSDERREQSYIGIHIPVTGLTTRFESNPSPLERALQQISMDALSRFGMKLVPISNWDGTPEALKNIDTDSILMIEIKKFWTEGQASLFRTNIRTTVQLVIHLGVKHERKVFTKNVDVEREMTVPRSTPERVEAIINEILTDIFDAYFSSPY